MKTPSYKQETMNIRVRLTRLLAECTKSPSMVYVNGHTIGDCLNNLVEKYPDSRQCFFDRNGGLIINISVNRQKFISHKDQLSLPVKEGDEIELLNVVAGG